MVELNPETFRIFSPDELNSNKLDECFEITHRNFQWDPETANNGGRVIEMLSEHMLQGWLQGYTLTGRHGLFPSYESFLGIVQTMIEVCLTLLFSSWPQADRIIFVAIRQVCQDGARDQVARRYRRSYLHRDQYALEAGAQRVLAPEPRCMFTSSYAMSKICS